MATYPVTTQEKSAPNRYVPYEEYLEIAGDTRLVEWVNGEVIEHMPPFLAHQSLVRFLVMVLDTFVNHLQMGTVIVSPFEVKLWPEGPSREPDLFFVRQERQENLQPNRFEGAPDIVVEVISPSSVVIDRVDKFSEYARAGVREYWLIDPRPHQQQADFYLHDETEGFVPAGLDENGVFHSAVLPGFWLDTAWLWPSPLPNPLVIVARIITNATSLTETQKAPYRAFLNALDES